MKPLLKYLFPTPKEDGGLSDIMRSVDVPHCEPELGHMEDMQPMIPLHVYGLHGLGGFRRDLNQEQKRTYRSVQDWASEQVRRNKE